MRQGARLKRDLFWFAQPRQRRRALLWLCLVALLSVTIVAHNTASGRYEAHWSYQESPLSPLATPLTATQSQALTTPLTAATSVEVSAPLTLPLTGQVTSPLTVPVTEVAVTAVPEATATAVATPVTTTAVVNQGQISLLLVGAVLASILVVIVVVLSRRR
jgi:hypothetical protein